MTKTEQLGIYSLTWPDGVFPLGGDTVALGDFATVRSGWRVCDLGTGSGALLLLLAQRQKNLTLTGVEKNPLAVQTARDNLSRNGLSGVVLEEDMRQCSLPAGQFDLVISNPPYFSAGSGASGGGERMEEDCTLEQLCNTAGRLLKNGGRFALCHRPERLCDVFVSLRASALEPKRLKLLAHSPAHAPYAILVEAVRQGKPGLEILPLG